MQAKRIGDLISHYLKSSGLTKRRGFKGLPEVWAEVVGPQIAQGSRVLGVHQHTLMIEVESTVLSHELSVYLRDEVLGKIREYYPQKRINTLKCVLKSE